MKSYQVMDISVSSELMYSVQKERESPAREKVASITGILGSALAGLMPVSISFCSQRARAMLSE